MPVPGRVGPLVVVSKLVIDGSAAVLAAFASFFAVKTAEKSAPVAEIISTGTDAVVETVAGGTPITTALKWIKYIFVKIPELVMLILNNLANFFYIFCSLIVLGQFDFLLDNVYTTIVIRVIVTYLIRSRS